ncbi:MAG: hydrogenase expression/formation protein HypE [Actinobacteria bacterium]|nr:hydrogenase expression/formation protein HypE [Actinomycetota bacterium]
MPEKIKITDSPQLKVINISHGDGGLKTGELINRFILKYLKNDILEKLEDSASLCIEEKNIAYTTDSFVVEPIFFPGGDIGKLSICGTINDLVTTGCTPFVLSLSLILEEGFPLKDLEKILISIRKTVGEVNLANNGVDLKIVTGDTKVVPKGFVDKIFINTSGIGLNQSNMEISSSKIKVNDSILINGSIGEHGLAILSQRREFNFKTGIVSDCAPLNSLINDICGSSSDKIHAMRDATRGGLARVLIEMAQASKTTIEIEKAKIPIKKEVRGLCEFLGMDPLYIANEGKMVIFVESKDAEKVLGAMRKSKYGKDSQIIGRVVKKSQGIVVLNTEIGTKRIIDLHYSEQLPRIC